MKHHKHNFTPSEYSCSSCGTQIDAPSHCGRDMVIEEIDGQKNWICWKGQHQPCCGKEAFFLYEACCENSNLTLVEKYQQVLSINEN